MSDSKTTADDGCCHKTRLKGAPCPIGRICPYSDGPHVGREPTEAAKIASNTSPPNNPVGYLITCQVAGWEGRNAVVINQGGPPALGYSIWSRDDMDRFIGELQTASANAWPALIEYEIDPNNPPPLIDEQRDELARLKAAQDREDESDGTGII